MTGTFKLKAPAKINIGLRVLSKRNDGFHNIETIFYPVRVFDTIEINIRPHKHRASGTSEPPDIRVSASPIPGINNEKNICHKAVELFFKNFKLSTACSIHIKIFKNIPAGAGLGGGSSDAAAVLKFLYRYFLRKTGKENKHILYRTALQLGSDVPFFIYGKPCYAYSRGEKLKPLTGFKVDHGLVLVYPGINVNTGWAYKNMRAANKKKSTLKRIKRFSPVNYSSFVNDFERVVFKKYPRIKKIKEKMYELGADLSLMSGSGSAVCGFFSDKRALNSARSYFEKRKFNVMCP